jgi:hypothetical protein
MKKTFILSGIILLLSGTALFAAPPNMQEGKWEITMAMKVEGVPFPMPPIKYTQCFTKEDVKDGNKTLPTGSDKKKDNCQVKDVNASSNSATWKIVCKDGTTGNGEITYKGSSYSSTMTLVNKNGGKTVNNINAKRIGDCK